MLRALSLPSIATAPTAWQPPSAHWPPSSPDPADGQMGLTLAAHRVAVGAIRAGPGCTGALPRHLLDFSGQRRRPLTPTPGSTIPTLRAESGRTHPMPSLVGPGGRSRHCCRLASASPRPVSRSPTVLHLFGRPRPWSSTAHDCPSLTSCRAPSVSTQPRAGLATSLTVYWNLLSLQGTTTANRSCPGGKIGR